MDAKATRTTKTVKSTKSTAQIALNQRIKSLGQSATISVQGAPNIAPYQFKAGSQVSDLFKHFDLVKQTLSSLPNLTDANKKAIEAQFAAMDQAKQEVTDQAIALGWLSKSTAQSTAAPSTNSLPPAQNAQLAPSATSPTETSMPAVGNTADQQVSALQKKLVDDVSALVKSGGGDASKLGISADMPTEKLFAVIASLKKELLAIATTDAQKTTVNTAFDGFAQTQAQIAQLLAVDATTAPATTTPATTAPATTTPATTAPATTTPATTTPATTASSLLDQPTIDLLSDQLASAAKRANLPATSFTKGMTVDQLFTQYDAFKQAATTQVKDAASLASLNEVFSLIDSLRATVSAKK